MALRETPMRFRRALLSCGLAALVGIAGLFATVAPASAHLVCDRWGRCWHVYRHYYPRHYYYGDYDYDPYGYGPGYDYGPPYRGYGYEPYYYGPGVSFGFT